MFLTLSSLAFVFSTCGEVRRWRSAEEFRQELRCGMTVQQVTAIAQRFGSSSFRGIEQHMNGATHALNEGSTVFWLTFDRDVLNSIQEGMYHGVTGLKTSIRENLCTREKTADVMLRVTAPSELAGASLTIDGQKRLGLSLGPEVQANIGSLPSGTHEIRIEKPGYRPIVKSYSYRPSKYWPEDNHLQINIQSSDIQRI